ncbi:MAG: prepilin-type N-terminal cleavage/methylation domain-containing protein [Planctomycetota bacterium]
MIRNNLVNKKVSRNGFTLIELLVVITIIAILATIIIPSMAKIRTDAKKMKCRDNLAKLYQALVMYDTEFKIYPRGDSYRGAQFWEVLRTLPTSDTAVLKEKNRDDLYICPLKGGFGGAGICHYRGPNFDVSDALVESDPIGADVAQNHDPKQGQNPINVLYWGGKVIEVKYNTTEWQQVESSLQE